jgi:hypothetical protein
VWGGRDGRPAAGAVAAAGRIAAANVQCSTTAHSVHSGRVGRQTRRPCRISVDEATVH